MIENFVPQPYPLECSADGETWMLVLGWTAGEDEPRVPVLAAPAGGTWDYPDPGGSLRYRLAAVRQVATTERLSPSASDVASKGSAKVDVLDVPRRRPRG